ncbi:hypothetical protein BY996DRAFT_6619601 [Phakopsora pachyrhizi]|nr:hypothetical protein BY996DRAFT_6619601 [Phakopsora pachyrhizi]
MIGPVLSNFLPASGHDQQAVTRRAPGLGVSTKLPETGGDPIRDWCFKISQSVSLLRGVGKHHQTKPTNFNYRSLLISNRLNPSSPSPINSNSNNRSILTEDLINNNSSNNNNNNNNNNLLSTTSPSIKIRNASSVSSSSNLYISNTHTPINQQQQLFLSQRDSSRSRNDRSIIKNNLNNSSSSSSSSSSSALSLYDSPSRTYSFLASNRKLNSSSRTTPTRSDQRDQSDHLDLDPSVQPHQVLQVGQISRSTPVDVDDDDDDVWIFLCFCSKLKMNFIDPFRLLSNIFTIIVVILIINLIEAYYRFKTLKPKTHLDLPMTPQQIRGSLLRNNATPHQSSLTSTPS